MTLRSALFWGCLALCLLQATVARSVNRDRQQNYRPVRTPAFFSAKSLTASNLHFTDAIYRLIAAQQTGNVFFSPLSIHAILTMTSLGAKGTTLQQLKKGLSLPGDVTTMREGYKFLIGELNNMTERGVLVKVANKVFVSQDFKLRSGYKEETREVFNSDAENINFGQSEEARQKINTWVEENTNQKIRKILPEGSLSPQTAMVLINSVYLKGSWKTKFEPKDTVKQKFYVSALKTVEIDMMHASGDFNYREDAFLDAKVLNLHYNNDRLSLLVVLPNQIDGLEALERKLTPAVLKDLAPHKKQRFNVNVSLPKFKLEESTQLNEILKKMGMTSMFSNSANLTGMLSEGQGLKVSDVTHKAFIEVNEEGTEAAAATAFMVQTLSLAVDEELDFRADHPFLFLLRHSQLHHVIFMGRYVAPSTLDVNL